MSALPTGTVTFLFTDLEVSTRLWDAEPDSMRGALARHDAILREAVSKHDGHLVKGTGDGIHAVFAILFTGKYPRGLYDFAVGVLRWDLRVEAYLLLMRDEYPPFTFAA